MNSLKKVLLITATFLISFPSFSQTQHEIQLKDGVIHYEVFGEGTPILVINGGPGMNSEGFRSLAALIGEKHQAFIYDQRGTGKSKITAINRSTITIDAMVKDIEILRKHLGVKKWIVFGHSFGGMLASYYATKHSEYISGLILSSSGGINMDLFNSLSLTSRLNQKNRDSLNYWASKIAQGDTSYKTRLQRGKYLAPAYLYDQSHVPAVAHRLTQGNLQINALVFQSMRAISFDCSKELTQFNKPVLIIQGIHDIIPQKISKYAHKVFPNSTLKIIEKSAHYAWLEQPDKYFSTLFSFTKKIVF